VQAAAAYPLRLATLELPSTSVASLRRRASSRQQAFEEGSRHFPPTIVLKYKRRVIFSSLVRNRSEFLVTQLL
jgi:hypothetical protein